MVETIPDILGICDRYWRYLLKAERDAGKKLALLIEKKMGIPRDVFVFGSAKKRQSAVTMESDRSLHPRRYRNGRSCTSMDDRLFYPSLPVAIIYWRR